MPSKNVIKSYTPQSYYHLYNRGVAKANIFLDVQDYKTFLSYLKFYLTPVDIKQQASPSKLLKNFFKELSLLCYCLMPNHFHLLLFQENTTAITGFMRSLMIKYSRYFNSKYHRVGPIFQGKLKAVLVTSEGQFIYLSKYIHRNPLPARSDLEGYKYSSYGNYLGLFNQTWLNTDEILSYFSKANLTNSYKKFVEEIDETDLMRIKDLLLDLEL